MQLQSNFPDFYLEDALPWLEATIDEKYNAYAKISTKIANEHSMPYGIAQHGQMSSFGPAAEIAEGAIIPQDRMFQGYSTTYKSKKYGLLLATSQEAIDHDKFNALSKAPGKMARSMNEAQEILFANIFNTGFATNGSDGQPLFSTVHPLLAPGAGTGSNTLVVAADLSTTSLKDLITVMRRTRDTAGNRIQIRPEMLLTGSALEFLAYEILKSTYLPEGNLNNLSSIGPQGQYKIEPVTFDYLTDDDAFFLVANKSDHEIHWFWDKKPETKTEMDFKSDVALSRILGRWATGYSDWRGVAGCTGA